MALSNQIPIVLLLILLCSNINSQTNDEEEDSYGWTVGWVWLMLTTNVISGIIIFVQMVYFIHHVRHDTARHSVNKWPVSFHIIMSVCGFISCMAYGLFRPNIIVNTHTDNGCYIIYCVSLFSWAVGRYFTLLSFLFRIWMAFKESVLAYKTSLVAALGIFLTVAAASVIVLLAISAVPVIVTAEDSDTLTLCMSRSTDNVQLAKAVAQAIDFGLVTILLFMFVKKLHRLRNMNKDDRQHKFKRTKSTTKSIESTVEKEKQKKEKERDLINSLPGKGTKLRNGSPSGSNPTSFEMSDKTIELSAPTTPNAGGSTPTKLKKKVSFMVRKSVNGIKLNKKDHGKPHKLDALEKLIMKQTILVFIVIISTWIALGWSIFDDRFSLFLGWDGAVNTLCSFFVFKYTNKFWNGCLHCCRCFCCYGCCMDLFGCFPCDGEDGCCSCCAECDHLVQRMGTSIRKLSSLRSHAHSRSPTPEQQLEAHIEDNKPSNGLAVNTNCIQPKDIKVDDQYHSHEDEPEVP